MNDDFEASALYAACPPSLRNQLASVTSDFRLAYLLSRLETLLSIEADPGLCEETFETVMAAAAEEPSLDDALEQVTHRLCHFCTDTLRQRPYMIRRLFAAVSVQSGVDDDGEASLGRLMHALVVFAGFDETRKFVRQEIADRHLDEEAVLACFGSMTELLHTEETLPDGFTKPQLRLVHKAFARKAIRTLKTAELDRLMLLYPFAKANMSDETFGVAIDAVILVMLMEALGKVASNAIVENEIDEFDELMVTVTEIDGGIFIDVAPSDPKTRDEANTICDFEVPWILKALTRFLETIDKPEFARICALRVNGQTYPLPCPPITPEEE